jgi:hypothetical protein
MGKDENYELLKKEYDEAKAKWDISNRKCLMIIRCSIIDTIRGVRRRPPGAPQGREPRAHDGAVLPASGR